MDKYPKLEHPPVVVAILQIKLSEEDFDIETYLNYEDSIRQILPQKQNNINVKTDLKIDGPTMPIGVSKTSATTEAKYESFVFMTSDAKRKLELSKNAITYIIENDYQGWDDFESNGINLLSILDTFLQGKKIERTSIRFINKFILNDLEHPEEYFNTLISQTTSSALPFKVAQYGFRLMIDISNNVYGVINQIANEVGDKYNYFFDIDILNKEHYDFTIEHVQLISSQLRDIKNELFFNNITPKTLDLCI